MLCLPPQVIGQTSNGPPLPLMFSNPLSLQKTTPAVRGVGPNAAPLFIYVTPLPGAIQSNPGSPMVTRFNNPRLATQVDNPGSLTSHEIGGRSSCHLIFLTDNISVHRWQIQTSSAPSLMQVWFHSWFTIFPSSSCFKHCRR